MSSCRFCLFLLGTVLATCSWWMRRNTARNFWISPVNIRYYIILVCFKAWNKYCYCYKYLLFWNHNHHVQPRTGVLTEFLLYFRILLRWCRIKQDWMTLMPSRSGVCTTHSSVRWEQAHTTQPLLSWHFEEMVFSTAKQGLTLVRSKYPPALLTVVNNVGNRISHKVGLSPWT